MSDFQPRSHYQARSIAEMFRESAQLYADAPAFATRIHKDEWRTTSYQELYASGSYLATALIELGVAAQEHVALLADNRLEWIISNYGIQLCGAVDVSRGTDVTDNDLLHILPHADVKVVFVEHLKMLEKLQKNRAELPNITHIILMDEQQTAPEGVLHLKDLLDQGKTLRQQQDTRMEARIAAIQPDDMFTLIYTSGTTGTPKGVMLSHANMLAETRNVHVELEKGHHLLAILPIWHIFERMVEMYAIQQGCCTYYTNIRTFAEDIQFARPHFMGSAPRLWEAFYAKLSTKVENAPAIRRGLFHAAYFFAKQTQGAQAVLLDRQLDISGQSAATKMGLKALNAVRWAAAMPLYLLLDLLVMKKVRAATGGQMLGAVSGGGALPPHIDEFFNYIGVPVLEGYGMTECPVVTVRDPRHPVLGTIGQMLICTEARIVDIESGEILYPNPAKPGNGRGLKGELHLKGDNVMLGYYKRPDLTEKVLKEGWLNTGDLAMMTYNDCLKIMGRSKDTIVLINGENVEPVPIENALCESPLVAQCMVTGQDQKSLGVLIVPSLEEFQAAGVQAEQLAELVDNPQVKALLEKEIKTRISSKQGFKAYKRLYAHRVLPKPFEVGEELTNLFKLKRHIVTDKYESLVKAMHQGQ